MSVRLKSNRASGWLVIACVEDNVLTMEAMPAIVDVTNPWSHRNFKSAIYMRTNDVDIIEEMIWTMAEDLAKQVPPLVARQLYRLATKLEDEIQSP